MLVSPEKCYGCAACAQACPRSCIEMMEDAEGFSQPLIQKDRCVGCLTCEKVCPALVQARPGGTAPLTVEAVWLKDENVLRRSSSGGAFAALSIRVLEMGGVVFGAGTEKVREVRHIRIESREELWKLQGSKYVQSCMKDSYQLAERCLQEGRKVLFSGTPCQIAGLYGFLTKEYEELYTVDFICHGVPSPGVLRESIDWKEKTCGKKVRSFLMRSKKRGWNSAFSSEWVFEDGQREYVKNSLKEPYMNGFLNNLFLRRTCYSCPYARTERISDITVGDFWGIGTKRDFFHKTSQGVSAVLLNTEKGKHLFDSCQSLCNHEERELGEVVDGQPMLSYHTYSNKKRENFFREFQTSPFSELVEKYLRVKIKYTLKKRLLLLIGYDNARRLKRIVKK